MQWSCAELLLWFRIRPAFSYTAPYRFLQSFSLGSVVFPRKPFSEFVSRISHHVLFISVFFGWFGISFARGPPPQIAQANNISVVSQMLGLCQDFPFQAQRLLSTWVHWGRCEKVIFLFNGFIQRIPLCRPIWQDSCLYMFLLTRRRKQGSSFLGLKLSLSIQIRMHRLWDETTRSCVRPLCFDVLKWSLFETSVKGKRPTLYTLWTKMTGTKTEEKTFGEIFDFGKVMMGKFRPQGTWQF